MARRNVTTGAQTIISWAGVDGALGRIAELDRSITIEEAEKAESLAKMKLDYDRQIGPIVEERDALASAIGDYCEHHREDLGNAKSRKLNRGTVGFRIGQPQLKTLAKWTWARVQESVERLKLKKYLSVKVALDKAAILADRDKLSEGTQRTIGVKIAQEERFYYEFPDVATKPVKEASAA